MSEFTEEEKLLALSLCYGQRQLYLVVDLLSGQTVPVKMVTRFNHYGRMIHVRMVGASECDWRSFSALRGRLAEEGFAFRFQRGKDNMTDGISMTPGLGETV